MLSALRLSTLRLFAIAPAFADPVTWYLHGVQYSGFPGDIPGYSVGQFTYDADTNSLSDWSILDLATGPSTRFPSSWAYTGPTSYEHPISPTYVELKGVDSWEPPDSFCSVPCGHLNVLQLLLEQPLTNAGGVVNIVPFNDPLGVIHSWEGNHLGGALGSTGPDKVTRFLVDGYLSTDGPSTTPEPATIGAVLLALTIGGIYHYSKSGRKVYERRRK